MATCRIYRSELMGWNPCAPYSLEHVSELMGESITAQELRDLDIPEADRLWVLAHALTREGLLMLAADVIERVLIADNETDPQAWRIVEISRRYATRKTPLSVLKAALNLASKPANDTGRSWQPFLSSWAVTCHKTLEGSLAQSVVGLVCKVKSMGHQDAVSAALDDAVRLLEVE